MSQKHSPVLIVFLTIILLTFCTSIKSQKINPDSLSPQALHETIMHMDSVLFHAFNTHTPANLELIKTLFTKDLEFYHDKTGLTDYDFNMAFFTRTLTGTMDLKRELVPGSMEVYPIKGYGAVETGSHRFCHTEDNKLDCGIFKFVNIWKYTNGKWQISRLISYDH